MKLKYIILGTILFILFNIDFVLGQGRPYEGPDDPAGDIAAKRAGFMNGNRVYLFFRNTTELSNCCSLGYDVSKWPNNYEGSKMTDGIALLIGARVYLKNDTIPVTDITEIKKAGNELDTLYYCQTSYRELMDHDKTGTIEWGLYPVFGYFNELSDYPAMSNLPESWPPQGWPARGGTTKWPGEWNGRFGRGVMKADLETYFVVNDAQDQEYLGDDDTVKYYPRPGVYIGDKKPDVTIQKGLPWGGIGIRIETRGFQWNNPQAADAIFWEYNISNISDYDLPEVYFGYWLDNAVGGEEGAGDDIAYYRKDLNMCYSWDYDGLAVGGGTPGIMGFTFLESPGLPFDGIDNDNDGIIDEKRDNLAMKKVGPTDGIYNVEAFLKYYNLKEEDLHEHWDADEDQDWKDGVDANGNGVYDFNEDPGDDLGLDGVGPLDLNYTGPDADGTECNHKPDFKEGVGAEPNFAITDVSETDMLGLTSFRYNLDWGPTGIQLLNDEKIFHFLTQGIFDEFQGEPLNFVENFASGLFPLYKGRTERVSMAELHSYDPLAGLMSEEHSAPALFRLKSVVQMIYETDYRFAQPPIMPTLKAIPGDGKVYLYWDNISDTKTRDPFIGNVNDFEGYKLYRATDKNMADAVQITDGYGTPTLKKPIFQCDVVDGKTGFTDFGYINGVGYYLGDDTGIKHFFVDNTVENGRTYYYVLVAYDYGIPDVAEGIAPSENTFTIDIDENENIRKISRNVAIVKPHQKAAGFIPPEITVEDTTNLVGTGKFSFEIFDIHAVKPGHRYKVIFISRSLGYNTPIKTYRYPGDIKLLDYGFRIYDVTDGQDSLVYEESPEYYSGSNIKYGHIKDSPYAVKNFYFLNNQKEIVTEPFDGIQMKLDMPFIVGQLDSSRTGWITGFAPMNVLGADNPTSQTDVGSSLPWDCEIIWGDSGIYKTRTTMGFGGVRDASGKSVTLDSMITDYSYNFYVINKFFRDSTGEYEKMDMIIHDINANGVYDWDIDEILVGPTVKVEKNGSVGYIWGGTIFSMNFWDAADESELPKSGFRYFVGFHRPFPGVSIKGNRPTWVITNGETKDTIIDKIYFSVKGQVVVDKNKLKEEMENIKVVPNPYVATNVFEEAVANPHLNQRRRIMFTHIPARCVIRIFTTSGILVKEIDVENTPTNKANDWDTNDYDNGTVFWDLRTKEGLEVAPGYYIYHVKSKETGAEKIGKFAIIK